MIAFIVIAWLISVMLLMLAWNYVLAGLFGIPEINFLHAIGISVLIGYVGVSFRKVTKP